MNNQMDSVIESPPAAEAIAQALGKRRIGIVTSAAAATTLAPFVEAPCLGTTMPRTNRLYMKMLNEKGDV